MEKLVINSIKYNLIFDQPVGVKWYDSDWNYQSTFNMPNIYYGIIANDFYYFSTVSGYTNGIVKTSLTSPTIIKSYGTSRVYRGLYYDSKTLRIFATRYPQKDIQILDLDLKLKSSVNNILSNPHSVLVYNSNVYVALYLGKIIEISNNGTVKTYSTKCANQLSSLSVDSFGYFALSCEGSSQVYIYDSNMQYTNKSIAFVDAFDARLDTNSRLAICGGPNVAIYN